MICAGAHHQVDHVVVDRDRRDRGAGSDFARALRKQAGIDDDPTLYPLDAGGRHLPGEIGQWLDGIPRQRNGVVAAIGMILVHMDQRIAIAHPA